jgi:hypothetical protein
MGRAMLSHLPHVTGKTVARTEVPEQVCLPGLHPALAGHDGPCHLP